MEIDTDDAFVPTERQRLLQLLWEDVHAVSAPSQEAPPQSARRQFFRSMFAVIEAAVWIFKQESLEQHSTGAVVFTPSELALLSEISPVLESDGTVRDAQSAIRFAPNLLFAFKCHARAHGCACVIDVTDHRWELLRRSASVRNRLMHPKQLASMHVSDEELSDARRSLSWFAKLSSLAQLEASGWFAAKAASKIDDERRVMEVQQLLREQRLKLRRAIEDAVP